MKKSPLCLLLAGIVAAPLFGQQKTYNWVPANDETVSLDPGYYHAGPAIQPNGRTGDVHVDVEAQQAVTVAMVPAQDWNDAAQRPEAIRDLHFVCVQQHLVQATYTCTPPPGLSMVAVVRDERPSRESFFGFGRVIDRHDRRDRDNDRDYDRDRDASAAVGAALGGRPVREFVAPNNVHVQYYDYSCTENCNLPDPPAPKQFGWVRAESETVRLDPANYYTSQTYHPGPEGGNMQVDIESRYPITIAMVDPSAWSDATQRPNMARNMGNINYSCVQQHAVRTTYSCHMGGFWPQALVIRDERDGHDHDRDSDRNQGNGPAAANVPHVIAPAIAGVSLAGGYSDRQFASPNDVRIQYYSWRCVQNCDQPDFGWVRQVKEKYQLTSVVKVYSGLKADHDGTQVSIKVKSPVPMAVAVLPSSVAGKLYGKPDMFESAVDGSSCQQRGVQSSTFQCTLNIADGPQSLVLVPEAGTTIPNKKKAEVEMQAVKCVDNCAFLPPQK